MICGLDSETSSTDDESIGDIYDDDEDSPDFIPLNLGESVCPPGCDQAVFQKTLALRKDRWKYSRIRIIFNIIH